MTNQVTHFFIWQHLNYYNDMRIPNIKLFLYSPIPFEDILKTYFWEEIPCNSLEPCLKIVFSVIVFKNFSEGELLMGLHHQAVFGESSVLICNVCVIWRCNIIFLKNIKWCPQYISSVTSTNYIIVLFISYMWRCWAINHN